MKQIIQSFKTGKTILEEVPAPQAKSGAVIIQRWIKDIKISFIS